jgi:hypothetical protein
LATSSPPSPPPSPLDLSSRLLPAALPAGDPETFAWPIFLEEPTSAFVSPSGGGGGGVAQLRCQAAHASRLVFECNGKALRSTNETEGRMPIDNGDGGDMVVKYRAISLEVKRSRVLDQLEEFSCRCLAVSAVGQVASRTVTVEVACKCAL